MKENSPNVETPVRGETYMRNRKKFHGIQKMNEVVDHIMEDLNLFTIEALRDEHFVVTSYAIDRVDGNDGDFDYNIAIFLEDSLLKTRAASGLRIGHEDAKKPSYVSATYTILVRKGLPYQEVFTYKPKINSCENIDMLGYFLKRFTNIVDDLGFSRVVSIHGGFSLTAKNYLYEDEEYEDEEEYYGSCEEDSEDDEI